MIVRIFHMGDYIERGKVRCDEKNQISVIETSTGSMGSFETVRVAKRTYTSKDGIEYMRAFLRAFGYSRAVHLSLEKGYDDKWYPQAAPNTTVEDLIGFNELIRQLSAKTGVPVIEIEKKWRIIKQKLSNEKEEGDEDFFQALIVELMRDLGLDDSETDI